MVFALVHVTVQILALIQLNVHRLLYRSNQFEGSFGNCYLRARNWHDNHSKDKILTISECVHGNLLIATDILDLLVMSTTLLYDNAT